MSRTYRKRTVTEGMSPRIMKEKRPKEALKRLIDEELEDSKAKSTEKRGL